MAPDDRLDGRAGHRSLHCPRQTDTLALIDDVRALRDEPGTRLFTTARSNLVRKRHGYRRPGDHPTAEES
ncbi:hypothetical protein [Salinicola acroporae]|uniref:hypothetical protein n=1 Tax=Salinicola acroporae TaxID=1541440 RepID=UPI0013A659A4|nr:hypothetical protein [Salinicola acroporae]